jgi:2',3'-cyclic-nucleotide 2'-phosphodiesterase (5'-nucleotidase family)
VEQERARGRAVLLVEAGNALFRRPVPTAMPPDLARARLILDAMGELRTAAMAVGARDLSGGVDFLRKEAARVGVPLLSANLVGPDGKALFPASTMVMEGGVRVGLVGLSPEGPVPAAPGVVGRPAVAAALAEARRLRGRVDVVAVLAAVPQDQAYALLEKVGPHVDFVLQSHEGRGAGAARGQGAAFLVPTGERGKQVGALELTLAGKGAFVDLEEGRRAQDALSMLDGNLGRARERLAGPVDEDTRKALQQAVRSMEARRKELARTAAGAAGSPARSFALRFVTLGMDVPPDAAWERRVRVLEPTGFSSH